MRVLWVTAEPPDRSQGGGSIRQAHLLDALAAHADITCVLYGYQLEDDAVRDRIGDLVEIPRVHLAEPGKTRRRLRELSGAARSRNPPEVRDYKLIRPAVASALRDLPPHDAMLIEHMGLAPLATHRTERRLLTMHNVASGTFTQQSRLTTGRRRWLLERQATQARDLERWCLDNFDTVFTVSEADAELLPGPSVVVPNGVDVDRYEPTPVPRNWRVSLIGTLGYLPNTDGAVWFIDEVAPLIRAKVPDVEFELVGRLPPPRVMALAAVPDVSVYPDVPDVRPHYLRSRVTVVPLRIGTGTRLKALEGMAAARPVVGTPVGMAGLEFEPGVQALVAEDARAFAEAVIAALIDDDLANRLGAEGRKLVQRKYAWEQVAKPFVHTVAGTAE